ncbi:MAG: response regulator [bacterium]
MAIPEYPDILIVDDDVEFRRSLTKILQKAGYHVWAASDAFQAEELFIHKFYPLILLDVYMPGKSGLKLLEEIKSCSPATKVIIVTVEDEKEIILQVQKAGAFAFLNKPVKREEILNYVDRAFESSQDVQVGN